MITMERVYTEAPPAPLSLGQTPIQYTSRARGMAMMRQRRGGRMPQRGAPAIDTAYRKWRESQAGFEAAERRRRLQQRREPSAPPRPRSGFTPRIRPGQRQAPAIDTRTPEQREAARRAAGVQIRTLLSPNVWVERQRRINAQARARKARAAQVRQEGEIMSHKAAFDRWRASQPVGVPGLESRSRIDRRKAESLFAKFKQDREIQLRQEQFLREAQAAIAEERLRSAVEVVPHAVQIQPMPTFHTPQISTEVSPEAALIRMHIAPPDPETLHRMVEARQRLGLRGLY